MTLSANRATPSFGVGAVIGETLLVLSRRFGLIFLLAFVPALIVQGLSTGLAPMPADGETAAFDGYNPIVVVLLFWLLPLIGYSLSASVVILAAFDTKLDRPVRLNTYLKWALLNIVPVTVLSLVAGVLAGIALIALIVPGLYVWSMFSMLIPAILIEGAGFRALGRSMALTKDYRWPVLGTLVVLVLGALLLSLIGTLAAQTIATFLGLFVGFLVLIAVSSVANGAVGVGVAMIYARLRELKEGVAVDTLAEGFD